MLQLIKVLHDNTMCAMQADKGRQGSWFQVSTGFKEGDVNAPLFFNAFLDSICRYIESNAGEPTSLVATVPAAEGQMVVCPAGSSLYTDAMVFLRRIVGRWKECLELFTRNGGLGYGG